MSLRKRVRKIETSLPPVEAVLLWVKEMLELGQERFMEETLADPRNPRVLLAKMIGDARHFVTINIVPLAISLLWMRKKSRRF